jgi:hypothetical protein
MLRLVVGAVLLSCFLTYPASQNFALSPTQENIDRTALVNENSILAISTPAFERELRTYGVAIEDDYIFELIRKYDWNAETMYNIVLCESGKNPNAHNFSHETMDDSWGLFQINLYGSLADERPSPEWLLVPENNVEYAYYLYGNGGLRHWRNCP